MSALLNVKQFVRFDEHGNLHVPNKLFVACQAYVQTPFLNDTSSRVATTEWVRAQIVGLTNVPLSETDPIWIFEKALYYTKVQADARYLQSFTETDPTVSAWAKASVKPTYAYSELTGLPTLFSGAYADLTGKPTIPAAQVNSDWTAITGLAQILNKPTLFSGSYTDLTNKPTIPTYTLSGLGGQPLDADLTAIAALSGTAGFLKKTAADTWALDNNTYLTSYTETDPIWTAEKTNYALKTYVDTSISNLVASAPATLDTLNELALALGSDASFSTTVTTLIGTKATDSAVVHLAGTETITGNKTFSGQNYFTGGTYFNYTTTFTKGMSYAWGGNSYTAGYLTLSSSHLGSTSSLIINDGDTQKTITLSFLNTANTDRDYTFPNASGTIALTSNLSSYVPYTGAATDVDLGVNSYIGQNLFIKSAVNNTPWVTNYLKLGYIKQSTTLTFTLGVDTGNVHSLIFTSGNSYAYTFPDANGTVALTSNLSSYVPTTRTITINGTALDLSADRAWTITTASTYTLPTASTTVLGGIKVGTNLSIDANGVLSSTDTNTTYSAFTGATASANGSSGLVTAPVIADRVKYLKGDGTWGTPTDTDTTYVAFTGSTTLADGAAGLVPKPVIANRLQYLRGDGTWATPPDTDTDTNTVTQIRRENADGTTSATAYRTGDIRLRQGANVTITEVSAGIFQIASSYVDTDTNTTYTAGAGLTLTGTVFSVTDTITTAATANTIAKRDANAVISAGGFYQTSSKTLKTSIIDYNESALDIINKINVVSFYYKADVKNKRIGFIAEDSPEEVATIDHNVMDTNSTVGLLLKAIQQLEARIKVLENV